MRSRMKWTNPSDFCTKSELMFPSEQSPVFAEAIEAIQHSGTAVKVLSPATNRQRQGQKLTPPLVPPANHTHHELVICLRGSMKIAGITTDHILEKGDAVLIRPGAWHYETYHSSTRNYQACWLMEGVETIHWNFTNYHQAKALQVVSGTLASLDINFPWEDLQKELHHKLLHWRARAQNRLVDLLVDLDRQQIERGPKAKESEPDALIKLLRILKTRFREPLQIKLLAKEVGMSPDYLGRLFHQAYGMTLKNYLNSIRIHQARHLLQAGKPIKLVAEECGFSDVYYFSRVFKAQCGTSPGKYIS